jgi:hypothetical protein
VAVARPVRRYVDGARGIIRLLEAKHGRDLFFSEVKDGPTWGGTHLRLDAIAIRKSWSPVRIMAYEVKVSRSDWLNDRKWEAYLPLAHELSIVAPKDVVRLDELPEKVGLFEVAATGGALRTQRKPTFREIEPPWSLLLYLLMSRTIPGDPHAGHKPTREERIASWKASVEGGRDLAYRVSDGLRKRIEAAERAGRKAPELDDLEEWLHENKCGWGGSILERVKRVMYSRSEKIEDAEKRLRRSAEEVATILNTASKIESESAR